MVAYENHSHGLGETQIVKEWGITDADEGLAVGLECAGIPCFRLHPLFGATSWDWKSRLPACRDRREHGGSASGDVSPHSKEL
jgi:hypothetical protein